MRIRKSRFVIKCPLAYFTGVHSVRVMCFHIDLVPMVFSGDCVLVFSLPPRLRGIRAMCRDMCVRKMPIITGHLIITG